jgi:hypothetical protein
MSNHPNPIGFAPTNLTDGRKVLDWASRYGDAIPKIRTEAVYLALILLFVPCAMVYVWLGGLQRLLGVEPDRYAVLSRYAYAWLAGTLGGTLFCLKWLYHVVAHGLWNMDRRLWRLFTPHVSGALAFGMTALVSSGLIKGLDATAMTVPSLVVGWGFLVGYFSDNAVAKLSEIAVTLFGTPGGKSGQEGQGQNGA